MRNSPVYNVISFTATVLYELLFLFYNIFNDLNHKKIQNFSLRVVINLVEKTFFVLL